MVAVRQHLLMFAVGILLALLSGCSGGDKGHVDIRLADGVVLRMVRIGPGRFLMGSTRSEQVKAQESAAAAKSDWTAQEKQHEVEIGAPFYIGVFEVSQIQYETVMHRNPSYFASSGGGKELVEGLDTSWFPVDSVSWENAMDFCRRLSEREGKFFDLPTEAEWEYACRAGTTTMFAFGNTLSSREANYYGVSQTTRAVGFSEPNGFGLSDMHGNVAEWCKDWYDRDYYSRSGRLDPPGPSTGTFRVIRGGCCFNPTAFCRSAAREFDRPNNPGDCKKGDVYGFRIVLRD